MSDDNTLPNDCSENISDNNDDDDDAESKYVNKLCIQSVFVEKKDTSENKNGDVLIVEEISSEEKRKRNILEVKDVYSDSEDERDVKNISGDSTLSNSQSVSDDTDNNDRSKDAIKLCIELLSEQKKGTSETINGNIVIIEEISSEEKNKRNILEVDDVYSDSEDERGEPVACTVTWSPLSTLKKKKSEKSPKQQKSCDKSPKKQKNLESPRYQKTFNRTEIMKAFERGFTREVVYAVSQDKKRRVDVYYYSPNSRKKLRSYKDVEKCLREHEIKDLSVINFTFMRNPLEVEEKYEVVRESIPDNNHKMKREVGIKSEDVTEEIRDNIAKTIEKVIISYGKNYVISNFANLSDEQESIDTKFINKMSTDGTIHETDFHGHLHRKGKKHGIKTSDIKSKNNKKLKDNKQDISKNKRERNQSIKKSYKSKKEEKKKGNSKTECYVKLFDVIKLSSKLKNVGKLSASMNEVSVLEKEKRRKIDQKVKERKEHKKLKETDQLNASTKEDCVNIMKRSLKEEKQDEGYKWTAQQEADDSDEELPKCATKFENAVIIGTKAAAGSIYNIEIPSVMFLEGQIVFNEKNVKKILKHQKKWPTHTLWILLTDISEMSATECDCFEYFEDESCPQSGKQEVMMLGKLDRIGSIISQAYEFAANVVPSLGEGSLLCLAPIIPSKIMCFGKKSTHTHQDLHTAVACDQDLALFANNPYKVVEYAAELERQWLQMMQKVIKKQEHPKEILDMYIMKKGLPVQIIEHPRDCKDNFPSRKIWEEFIFYILKYAGFACKMKDHCSKIAEDRICRDFESDSDVVNMEQKRNKFSKSKDISVCDGSKDLLPNNGSNKVMKVINVSKIGYETNTATQSEKFMETLIDRNINYELEDCKNSKNTSMVTEKHSTPSEFLEPVDSNPEKDECISINDNKISNELNNDKCLTLDLEQISMEGIGTDSDNSQKLNTEQESSVNSVELEICKDIKDCRKDEQGSKNSVKDINKIKESEKLNENAVATLIYSEKLTIIKHADEKILENCESVIAHKCNDKEMSKNTETVISSLCVSTKKSENIEHFEITKNTVIKDTNLLKNINIETFGNNKTTLDDLSKASSDIIEQSKCIEKLMSETKLKTKNISSEGTCGRQINKINMRSLELETGDIITPNREIFLEDSEVKDNTEILGEIFIKSVSNENNSDLDVKINRKGNGNSGLPKSLGNIQQGIPSPIASGLSHSVNDYSAVQTNESADESVDYSSENAEKKRNKENQKQDYESNPSETNTGALEDDIVMDILYNESNPSETSTGALEDDIVMDILYNESNPSETNTGALEDDIVMDILFFENLGDDDDKEVLQDSTPVSNEYCNISGKENENKRKENLHPKEIEERENFSDQETDICKNKLTDQMNKNMDDLERKYSQENSVKTTINNPKVLDNMYDSKKSDNGIPPRTKVDSDSKDKTYNLQTDNSSKRDSKEAICIQKDFSHNHKGSIVPLEDNCNQFSQILKDERCSENLNKEASTHVISEVKINETKCKDDYIPGIEKEKLKRNFREYAEEDKNTDFTIDGNEHSADKYHDKMDISKESSSDCNMYKLISSFDHAIIIGSKEAAGRIYDHSVSSLEFLEGKATFNEKMIKKVLKHQSNRPESTLWIFLVDLSFVTEVHLSCKDLFVDSCIPYKEEKILKVQPLTNIKHIIGSVKIFADNLLCNLKKESAVLVLPLIPFQALSIIKESLITHDTLHRTVKKNIGLKLFRNSPYLVKEYFINLEKDWLVMMKTLMEKQNLVTNLLEDYENVKEVPVLVGEPKNEDFGTQMAKTIWEDFLIIFLSQCGFGREPKDSIMKSRVTEYKSRVSKSALQIDKNFIQETAEDKLKRSTETLVSEKEISIDISEIKDLKVPNCEINNEICRSANNCNENFGRKKLDKSDDIKGRIESKSHDENINTKGKSYEINSTVSIDEKNKIEDTEKAQSENVSTEGVKEESIPFLQEGDCSIDERLLTCKRVVIIGDKSLAKNIHVDVPIVQFIDLKTQKFESNELCVILRYMKARPPHTLWILLTDISLIATSSILGYGISKTHTPILLNTLKNHPEQMIKKTIENAEKFVKDLIPHLGHGSAIVLAPVKPLRFSYVKGNIDFPNCQKMASADPDLTFFECSNVSNDILKFLCSWDRWWSKKVTETLTSQKLPLGLLNLYLMKKGISIQKISTVKECLVNFRAIQEWEKYIIKFAEYFIALSCSEKDNLSRTCCLDEVSTPMTPLCPENLIKKDFITYNIHFEKSKSNKISTVSSVLASSSKTADSSLVKPLPKTEEISVIGSYPRSTNSIPANPKVPVFNPREPPPSLMKQSGHSDHSNLYVGNQSREPPPSLMKQSGHSDHSNLHMGNQSSALPSQTAMFNYNIPPPTPSSSFHFPTPPPAANYPMDTSMIHNQFPNGQLLEGHRQQEPSFQNQFSNLQGPYSQSNYGHPLHTQSPPVYQPPPCYPPLCQPPYIPPPIEQLPYNQQTYDHPVQLPASPQCQIPLNTSPLPNILSQVSQASFDQKLTSQISQRLPSPVSHDSHVTRSQHQHTGSNMDKMYDIHTFLEEKKDKSRSISPWEESDSHSRDQQFRNSHERENIPRKDVLINKRSASPENYYARKSLKREKNSNASPDFGKMLSSVMEVVNAGGKRLPYSEEKGKTESLDKVESNNVGPSIDIPGSSTRGSMSYENRLASRSPVGRHSKCSTPYADRLALSRSPDVRHSKGSTPYENRLASSRSPDGRYSKGSMPYENRLASSRSPLGRHSKGSTPHTNRLASSRSPEDRHSNGYNSPVKERGATHGSNSPNAVFWQEKQSLPSCSRSTDTMVLAPEEFIRWDFDTRPTDEFTSAEKYLFKIHKDQYEIYKENGEKHPKYHICKSSFINKYEKVSPKSSNLDTLEKLWAIFWQEELKKLEEEEWKYRKSSLIKTFQNRVISGKNNPTSSDRLSGSTSVGKVRETTHWPNDHYLKTNIDTETDKVQETTDFSTSISERVVLEESIGAVSELVCHLGIFGHAILELLNNVVDQGYVTTEAFALLKEYDSKMLLDMAVKKFKECCDKDPSMKDKFTNGIEYITKIIDISHSTPKNQLCHGVDIEALVKATKGKDNNSVIRFIRDTLEFEGVNPTQSNVGEIFLAVQKKK